MTWLESALPPLGRSAFQLSPNSERSIVVSNARPILVLPMKSSVGPAIVPVAWIGRVFSLDRHLALELDLVALEVNAGRTERELGVLLGVEELRGLQMADQVRVLDVYRADFGRTPQIAFVERGAQIAEAAAELRHQVLDRELGRGMGRVQRPVAGETFDGSGCGHVVLLLELSCGSTLVHTVACSTLA